MNQEDYVELAARFFGHAVTSDVFDVWLRTLKLPRLRVPGSLIEVLNCCNRPPSGNGLVVAELGSFAGEGSEQFLLDGRVGMLYCVDLWEGGYDGGDVASGSDMEAAETAFDLRTAAHRLRMTKLKLSTAMAALRVAGGSLDLIYLDAGHRYAEVAADLGAWLPKLKTGGVAAGHDYGNPRHPGVKKAVDEVLGCPDAVFGDTSWVKRV